MSSQIPITDPQNANAALSLWRAAAQHGARPAVIDRASSMDYLTLLRRTAAIAAGLVAAGAAPDGPVAILLERGSNAAAAYFAALGIGAIAVLLNDALRPRQIEYILEHSGARHLLTTAEILTRQPRAIQGDVRIVEVEDIREEGTSPFVPASRAGKDVAQLIYTSGSTGSPKGVAVSHGNLSAWAGAVVSYLGITPEDRIAGLLPFGFVYGLSQLLCATTTGAALVIERSPLAPQIIETVRANRVTVLAAVPPLWQRLLSVAAFRNNQLPTLRAMTNAGGHLPTPAVRALRRAQPAAQLYLMYGLTETLRSTYLPPEEVDQRPDSIGRAIPGADLFVVREDGTPAAPGEVGELVHRGPTVTLGYWKDPERTAQVFRPDPLRAAAPESERVVFTGDLVRRDAAGFLYFVSRRDRIIKTMGYKVGPDEIANVLYDSGEVADAAVVGEPDDLWGQRIVVHVVLVAGGSVERLKAYCGRELPRYLQPARFEVLEALPTLPSGKHDIAAVWGSPGAASASTAQN
jgi:amino acid adenylation domain-containing protein